MKGGPDFLSSKQLGSLLSYGLAHIASQTLYPYQIIFLFCGLLTGMSPVVLEFNSRRSN